MANPFFSGKFFSGGFFKAIQAATSLGGRLLKRKKERRARQQKELIMMVKNIAPYAFERLYQDEQ